MSELIRPLRIGDRVAIYSDPSNRTHPIALGVLQEPVNAETGLWRVLLDDAKEPCELYVNVADRL